MKLKKMFGKCLTFSIFAFLMLLAPKGGLQAQVEYTGGQFFGTIGNSTWTVPSDTAKVLSVTFEAIGGGGAGGRVNRTGLFSAFPTSAGGSGAAYARSIIENPTAGDTYSIVVGAGGTNPEGTATDGGESKVSINGSDVVKAAGGVSVTGTNNQTQATAALVSASVGNSIIRIGGNGSAPYSGSKAGHGGGAGGPDRNGGDAVAPTRNADGSAGVGGGGDAGNGAKGSQTGSSWPGNPPAGDNYGGGGAGAWCTNSLIGLIPNKAPGGPGAQGCVRVTYTYVKHDIEVADLKDTICSATRVQPTIEPDLFNLDAADTRYSWDAPTATGILGITAGIDQTDFSQTLVNTTDETQIVVYTVTATNEGNSDEFTITVYVYPEAAAGTISADQLVCQDMVINTFVSDTDPSGGGENPTYGWQVSYDGSTWTDVDNANALTYIPATALLTDLTNQFRRTYTTSCGTMVSNVLVVTNPNPLDPGSIDVSGDPAGGYCGYDDVNATLTATPTARPEVIDPAFTYQWQQSIAGGAWTDIAGATSSTYTVSFEPVTTTISYRYQVKYEDCAEMTSNSTYDITKLENVDYTDQFTTYELAMDYGYSDADFSSIPTPVLDPTPISITPNFNTTERHAPGTYTISWTVEENCGTFEYNQDVVVALPPCGDDLFAEDIEGHQYATMRVGLTCWMAENLRSTLYSDGTNIPMADVYTSPERPDLTENEENFGRLYSWYSAMRVSEGNNEAVPAKVSGATGDYVQGACPKGWGLPTAEEYNQVLAEAGDADHMKSPETSDWLPGHAGPAANKFDAVGAGFRDNFSGRYENILAQTDFWTVTTGTTVVKGVCSEITHTCPSLIIKEEAKGRGFSIRCVKKN